FLISRNGKALEKLKNEIAEKYQTPVQIFQADIKETSQIKAVFESLNQQKNYIDVLVNNAGIMVDSSLMTLKEEDLKGTFETNVFGAIAVTQIALKSLIKKKGGSIIFMSSVVGTKGSAGQSAYSSSKSALIGLTKSLSKELASLNIRVNAIAPGFITTDLTNHYTDEHTQKVIETIGMKRAGKTEEVANVILFLSSDLSSYVTGQIIEVDGGMII
ncbi:MAG: SDR family NAD(P)-dependent oxidoreductase, partial [Bacteroidia bacterium]